MLPPPPPPFPPSNPSFLSKPTLKISEMSGKGSFRLDPAACDVVRAIDLPLCRELCLCAFLFLLTNSTLTGVDRMSAAGCGCGCGIGIGSSEDIILSGPAENWKIGLGADCSDAWGCADGPGFGPCSPRGCCCTLSSSSEAFSGDALLCLWSESSCSSSLSLFWVCADPSYRAVAHCRTLQPSPSCKPRFSLSRNFNKSSRAS